MSPDAAMLVFEGVDGVARTLVVEARTLSGTLVAARTDVVVGDGGTSGRVEPIRPRPAWMM